MTRLIRKPRLDRLTPQGRHAEPEAAERLFSRTQWQNIGGNFSRSGNRDHRDAHPQER